MRPLTAELERSLRREHARLHPGGLLPKAGYCEVCLLLDALTDERETARKLRRAVARCASSSPGGYRCAQGAGHDGPHSHPLDPKRQAA